MTEARKYYPPQSSVGTGLRGTCPRCGQGKLFTGYLTVASQCDRCDLKYDFADSGDGASWFVMLIAGTLATVGVLFVELTWQPPYWVHAIVAIPLALLLPLALLRPAKGIMINRQFQTNARPGSQDTAG